MFLPNLFDEPLSDLDQVIKETLLPEFKNVRVESIPSAEKAFHLIKADYAAA
jgi:ABC-type Fe3+/spermidine/putrescine transport system ATPase subunit